jgi:hypothetical protein
MAKSFHLREIVDWETGNSGFNPLEKKGGEEPEKGDWQFSLGHKSLDESALWKTALFLALKEPAKAKKI